MYHYHSKMIMKDAKVGGAWAWHQDYGYWYQNGVLFPLLTSVFIAVDPCHAGERLPAGHRAARTHCGRIDHVLTGDQAGADRERVRARSCKRLAAGVRRDGTGRRAVLPLRTCCTAPTRTARTTRAGR